MPNITLQISNSIKGTLTNKSKLWKAPQQLLNMLKKGLPVTKLGLELGMAKSAWYYPIYHGQRESNWVFRRTRNY